MLATKALGRYGCYLSESTKNGDHRYRYSQFGLNFPAAFEASGLATTVYRVLVLPKRTAPGAQPLAAANCRIPNTFAALQLISTLDYNGISASSQAGAGSQLSTNTRSISASALPSVGPFTDDKRRIGAIVNVPVRPVADGDPGTGYLPNVYIYASDCPIGAYCISTGGGGWLEGADQSQSAPSGYYYDPGVPSDLSSPPPQILDDYALTDSVPKCSAPKNDKETAWCSGDSASTDERTKIQAALARMAAKGGVCASLAAIGTSLLNANSLHMYDQSWYNFGGAAPMNGGKAGWVVVSRTWTATFYDTAHVTPTGQNGEPQHRDLQQLLAHELDHLAGRDHVGSATPTPDPYNTPNSNACSDITNFYN